MAHPYHHALSSVRKHGGVPGDYLALHNWFDASKEFFGDFRHRALRHHAQGIFEAERVFGVVILNSEGKHVPTRVLAEQHVREDCGGRIPSIADWFSCIKPQPWMGRAEKLDHDEPRPVGMAPELAAPFGYPTREMPIVPVFDKRDVYSGFVR